MKLIGVLSFLIMMILPVGSRANDTTLGATEGDPCNTNETEGPKDVTALGEVDSGTKTSEESAVSGGADGTIPVK